MKIVAIADMHGNFPDVPQCDLCIIAGDSLGPAQAKSYSQLAAWLYTIPATNIVGIAGNHDTLFAKFPGLARELLWQYLDGEIAIVEDVRIFGHPYVPRIGQWLFTATEAELADRLGRVPQYDIMVSHGPPIGALDLVDGYHVGSVALRDHLVLKRPNLCICGHIHDNVGRETVGSTLVVNAAVTTITAGGDYELAYLPTEIDYQGTCQ